MSSTTFGYRLAGDGDAAAIARLHTRSWRCAYRGQLPDAFLDGDLADEHAAAWARRFAAREGTVTVVATDPAGALAGFAHTVLRDHPEWGSLLDNLHVRPDLRRHGIGRRLLAETAARLLAAAPDARLYLEVIEANQAARRFYRALGAAETGGTTLRFGDREVPVLVYTWDSLDELAAPVPAGGTT